MYKLFFLPKNYILGLGGTETEKFSRLDLPKIHQTVNKKCAKPILFSTFYNMFTKLVI